MTPLRDRIIGCLLWGIAGDALGGVGERGSVSQSDDTQLTLATCESIRTNRGVSPEHIASTVLQWFNAGAITGLGSSTLKALRDLQAGAHWALAGARGEMAAGNGAAMRIAPLAFVLDPLIPAQRTAIRDVCRITHHSDEAYIGALAVLLAIRSGAPLADNQFLSGIAQLLPDSRVRDRLMVVAALDLGISATAAGERLGASGYVVDTVSLALLLATRLTPMTFESELGSLSASGADADTIGSIAGQIAGAHLGAASLPRHVAELSPVRASMPDAEAFARFVEGSV
jgi:ADP-ribosyl-[dinitrogen reductase] hydrolase